MPTMTANNDQVSANFVGQGMDFCLRSAEDEMPVSFCDSQGFSKFSKVRFGGILYLFLDGREVHWNVATVGQ